MSMPKVPDINSDMNLTFEQAVNLMITSIAMEEISLSKLIDAEKEKVLKTIKICNSCKEYSYENGSHKNILEINNSVNTCITNIIKLQMLLHQNLETVERLLCSTKL